MLRVLILGGTGDARQLASALDALPAVQVISSLAGRVGSPLLPVGEVRVGGFGGADGLAAWLVSEQIDAVIDATHPFAATMSLSAAHAAATAGVPLLGLRRAGWTERSGDDWRRVSSLAQAAEALPGLGERVFVTTGRKELAPFAELDAHWFLIRSIDAPEPPLPLRLEVLLDRGPFDLDAEIGLMRQYEIDVLVTKDSGGHMTSAKLDAARELGLPVVMVNRPAAPDVPSLATVAEALAWVRALST
jgi:precorrin-6A/cobalt-precorrin-6A reductase